MKKSLKRIVSILPYIFFALAVFIILQIVIAVGQGRQPSLFGYSINYVLTPSMEPTIMQGDLVIMKQVDPKTLTGNEIVNFSATVQGQSQSFTHRIVNITIVGEDYFFTTRGDNNSSSFDWETNMVASQIHSVYIGKSTFLGSLYRFIFNQGINYVYLIVILLFITIAIGEFKTILKEYKKLRLAQIEQDKEKLVQLELERLRKEQVEQSKQDAENP